jgi:hypothetical protein
VLQQLSAVAQAYADFALVADSLPESFMQLHHAFAAELLRMSWHIVI